jgi:hypothetical protein
MFRILPMKVFGPGHVCTDIHMLGSWKWGKEPHLKHLPTFDFPSLDATPYDQRNLEVCSAGMPRMEN